MGWTYWRWAEIPEIRFTAISLLMFRCVLSTDQYVTLAFVYEVVLRTVMKVSTPDMIATFGCMQRAIMHGCFVASSEFALWRVLVREERDIAPPKMGTFQISKNTNDSINLLPGQSRYCPSMTLSELYDRYKNLHDVKNHFWRRGVVERHLRDE